MASLNLLKAFERQGCDPRLWYNVWCRDAGVSPELSGIEVKILTDTLLMGGRYDQLKLPSLPSMEMICQFVEAYHDGEPRLPSWEGLKYILPSLSHGRTRTSASSTSARNTKGVFRIHLHALM